MSWNPRSSLLSRILAQSFLFRHSFFYFDVFRYILTESFQLRKTRWRIYLPKRRKVGGGGPSTLAGNSAATEETFKIQIGISKKNNFTFKCYIFGSKIDWIGIPQKSLFVTKHATYAFYSKMFSQFQLDKSIVFICNIKIFLKMPFFTVCMY